MQRFVRGALLVALLGQLPYACGSDGGSSNEESSSDGGQSSSDAGNTDAPGVTLPDSGAVVLEDGQVCAAEALAAELTEIDLYVMLDSSGSMLDMTASGASKWDAIVESLIQFVEAPETEPIGIGLQYFPQQDPDAPSQCSANADCGAEFGPCSSSLCVEQVNDPAGTLLIPTATGNVFCNSASDCAAGSSCQQAPGICTQGTSFVGVSQGNTVVPLVCGGQADCPDGTTCGTGACELLDFQGAPVACSRTMPCPVELGSCLPFVSTCTNATLCDAADYSTPAVPISVGATRNDDIVTSLNDRMPDGLTPTGPALEGAIAHAREWALDHPDRRAVAVLATDGFPTECDALDIDQVGAIAQAGLDGTPSVQTYVIGVFADAEAAQARDNLNRIAEAGGTEEAFVVSTAGDVAQQFLESLNSIRDAVLGCDFEIPSSDDELDLDLINVQLFDASGTTLLSNVGEVSGCDDDPSGWYYDAAGTTRVRLCPGACETVQQTPGVQVSLLIGCQTKVR